MRDAHAGRRAGDRRAQRADASGSASARARCTARLAEAEARTHGTTADAIRFHEVGQIDAILDVAATCVALDLLEIDELRCSPFPIGHGSIGMQHGLYPNPPPATAQLLIGWPTRAVDVAGELVTPTAAAILTTLATPGRPDMIIERIGYGAGRSDFAIPNVTRVVIGTAVEPARAAAATRRDGDDVVVLEANIDDMSPQHYELALERLFAAGALDVWLTPIAMKKGRPAITLSAMAAPRDEDAVAHAMLDRDDDDRRARANRTASRAAAQRRDGRNAVRRRARQARGHERRIAGARRIRRPAAHRARAQPAAAGRRARRRRGIQGEPST